MTTNQDKALRGSIKLPTPGQVAIYATDLGTVHIEPPKQGNRRGYFFPHNVTTGEGYVGRTRLETIGWLVRHAGRFVEMVTVIEED